ncbi:hypothetical protein C1645_821155 [Glomus cerebriforme]|uniref:Uncharacterized protein n=1 Tax=Glomus cerebriforme TaxID=658196 RepID=A0A397T0T0_9GLOM|nr:hypothetical protein C1645_821155 [Glomus cerebriforme]
MIATFAVEMKINSTSLIQEAGHTGRNKNTATYFIFYGKKDICTNYSIIAKY